MMQGANSVGVRTQSAVASGWHKGARFLKTALLALAAAAALLIGSCVLVFLHYFYDPPYSAREKRVHETLRQAVAAGGTEIDVTRVTDFQWAQVCMARPYVGEDELHKAIGAQVAGYRSIGWVDNEGYWSLVFVSQGRLIALRMPRMALGDYDLPPDAWAVCVTRDDAVLRLQPQRGQGLPPRRFQLGRRSFS